MTTSDDVLFLAAVASWVALFVVGGLCLVGLCGVVRIRWRHWRQRWQWHRLDAQLRRQWPGLEDATSDEWRR